MCIRDSLNKEMVSVETVTSKYDVIELKDMLKEHVAYTNSEKGKEILKDFEQYLPKFKKIMPNDYKAMLNLIVQMEERGLSSEQAKMEAFNIKEMCIRDRFRSLVQLRGSPNASGLQAHDLFL